MTATLADVMDAKELAALIGLKPDSIRWYLSQRPERLPPRVAYSRKPLWSRAVVLQWLASRDGMQELQARLKPLDKPVERPPRVAKVGRPRRVPQAA